MGAHGRALPEAPRLKLSVVVPAYNEEKLLAGSLAAIRAAAASAFGDAGWELIVCDNNSTDRTAEIARAAGATVVFEPHNQISRARNRGAAAATGEWLLFVDADSTPSGELFLDLREATDSGRVLGGGSTAASDHDALSVRAVRVFSLLPSSTQTVTATLTLTIRPTFAPLPSFTGTVSPTSTSTSTSTLYASLTPAIPVDENDRYALAIWQPEYADQLIQIMEAYPDSLSAFSRGEDNSGYYAAFDNAIFALREALLQFPAAPQAQSWFWRLAYNLARTGDPQAGANFSYYMTQELNTGQLDLDNLYEWGLAQDPPVLIDVISLDTPPGFLATGIFTSAWTACTISTARRSTSSPVSLASTGS